MAVQGNRLFNRASSSRKSRRQYVRNKKIASSLLRDMSALLGKLSVPLMMLLILAGLAFGLVKGYAKLDPQYMVTVQPFEIAPGISNGSSLSGKSASDIVVDILNDAASHAEHFHGTDYYKYDVCAGAQPVSLHQAIKVPLQIPYGIELKGISLDSVRHLYDQTRYEQWIIGGDVISSPDGLVGRIWLNRGDTTRFWNTLPSAHAAPYKLVRDATYLMLESVDPERLGLSYLQEAGESQSIEDEKANYHAAEKVFRQWAIDEPQNWKPSYYLSLVYAYQGRAQEASNLASWSQNISLNEADKISKRQLQSAGSEKEMASDVAQIMKIALGTRDTSDAQSAVATLELARSKLDLLFTAKPKNVDYLMQRARVLDREALIELEREPTKAPELSTQAIESLDQAIQQVPENGGLHEQRAILLMHLVTIMKKQCEGSPYISAKESEEVKDYTRALELRPTKESALWGAVYAQIDLGNGDDAVDLARTIMLLQPDSKAANAAYIVALERVIGSPANATERDKEVELRLTQLLQSKPDKSQLLAVLDALLTHDNQKRIDLVVAEGERHFPMDSDFEQRKLQAMSSLLHIPIKPEAYDLSCCQLIQTNVRDDKLRAGLSLHLRLRSG